MVTSPDLVYCTPDWVINGLLVSEEFNQGRIWEPACGYGAISKVLRGIGLEVYSSDKNYKNYGFGSWDFLLDHTPLEMVVDHIITNPPFSLAQEFVIRGLEVASQKVCLLLRLAFLESQERKEFFESTPLKKVLVSSRRITMYPENYEGEKKNGGTMAMAWFIWDKQYEGKPYLEWF